MNTIHQDWEEDGDKPMIYKGRVQFWCVKGHYFILNNNFESEVCKCQFCDSEIAFLNLIDDTFGTQEGYVSPELSEISKNNPNKLEAIYEIPKPGTLRLQCGNPEDPETWFPMEVLKEKDFQFKNRLT